MSRLIGDEKIREIWSESIGSPIETIPLRRLLEAQRDSSDKETLQSLSAILKEADDIRILERLLIEYVQALKREGDV